MTTRSMGAGAGWRWIVRAVNLGGSNPTAIFGGAALLLLVIIVLAIALGGGMAATMPALEPGSTASFATSLLVTLPILLVMACMTVGYLRVIRAVETGQPASATGVFSGFGDMRVSLRAIGFILLLAIVQNVLLFGLMHALAPQMVEFYMQSMQFPPVDAGQQQMPVLPEGFWPAFLLIWLVGLLVYAVQAIGIGQIALNDRGVLGAIGDGAAGAFKNLLPLLVLLLAGIGAAIAVAVVVVLLALVVGLLAKLLGTWIAFVIGIPLYVAFVVAMLVVAFGVMYHIWHDVSGDDAGAPALRDDSVEL